MPWRPTRCSYEGYLDLDDAGARSPSSQPTLIGHTTTSSRGIEDELGLGWVTACRQAVGMALSLAKMDGRDYRVYTIIWDGELAGARSGRAL